MKQSDFGRLFGFSAPQVRVTEIETGKVKVSAQVAMLCRYIQTFGILPDMQENEEKIYD
jgi:hypothetical protein